MERPDALYGTAFCKRCKFSEQVLDRAAVFADYVEVIAPCLAAPVIVIATVESAFRKGSEFAEGICAVENSLAFVKAYHNLWPVNHRSIEETQAV